MSSSSLSKPVSNWVSLALGVDDKTKGKIHAGEFVKFSFLLHSQRSVDTDNYKNLYSSLYSKPARGNQQFDVLHVCINCTGIAEEYGDVDTLKL